jgi:gliding motility-associated-like protein
MLFTGTTVFAQLPDNIGFEKGNFDGWECSLGERANPSGVVTIYPPSGPSNRHTIIDATYNKNQLDPYGNFPVVCPNGSKYSVQLGDDAGVTGHVQRMTYTFTVPPTSTNYSIIFNYAVVLEDGGHIREQQPLFTAKVYDVTDNKYIDCPSFDFSASSTLPGFQLSKIRKSSTNGMGGGPVYYKDWSTATIDLKGYPGKIIRIEFTTLDCAPDRHFGYAYIDVDETNSTQPITGNSYCTGQGFITLLGPTGFADYKWYKNTDFTTVVGTGQSLTISPAPVDGSMYALKLSPYQDLGCEDTLYTTVNKINKPFNLVYPGKIYGCPGKGVNLTDLKYSQGSEPGMKFYYYTDILGLNYLPNPDAVGNSGIYYIKAVNPDGCLNIVPVEVAISEPKLVLTNLSAAQFPAKVDLSTAFIHEAGMTYSYYEDAAGKIPLADYRVSTTNTYYIKATTSEASCSLISPVKVVVNPPPPYTIIAPNTFTPNNDGINDNFSIKIDGYVSMVMLRIFNRYGQLVYTTKSINDIWKGNVNSQELPAGSYYWIFDGMDDYFHTKVTRSASITIIR